MTTMAAAGTMIHISDLTQEGFRPHELRFRETPGELQFCEWDTLGDIPRTPGLYAFTLGRLDDPEVRVMYVGMTTHLWMVTKGRLPDGSSRPAQRYGRHKFAGATRARVNAEIALARSDGAQVLHWLRPIAIPDDADPKSFLLVEEEKLISGWRLRTTGWNRG